MDRKNNPLRKAVSLLLAMVIVASFAACGDRTSSDPSSSEASSDSTSSSASSGDSSASGSSSLGEIDPPSSQAPSEPAQEVIDKLVDAHNKNSDVVGWLTVPDTTIDDAVVQGKDNAFYERRNAITKEYDWYGCYYADAGNRFGTRNELSSNTVIYGHNMTDKVNDVKLSPLFNLVDFNKDGVSNIKDDDASAVNVDWATNHPYIYFSTADDDMVWQIYAAFFTDLSFQYHLENPDAATLQKIINEAKERSYLTYDVDVNSSDKILTLSTCTYKYENKRRDQRFVVQARLLRPGETVKETVSVKKNPNPRKPVFQK